MTPSDGWTRAFEALALAIERQPAVVAARWSYDHAAPQVEAQALVALAEARVAALRGPAVAVYVRALRAAARDLGLATAVVEAAL